MQSEVEAFFTGKKIFWFVIYTLVLCGAYYVFVIGRVTWSGEYVAIAGTCYQQGKGR